MTRPSRAWRVALEAAAVLIVAGAIAVIITWPLAMNFSTEVVGGNGAPSDTMGYWWDIWNNHRNGLDLWGAASQDQIGYPFGRPIVGSGNLLLLVFTGPALLIASFASAAATFNTLALAGLALSGASMYLLIRWLRLGIGIAAWAGLVLMLSPYVMFRSTAHVPLAHMEWAPLLLMAGIAWIMRPTWRRALLLAAATLFGWITNPYFGAMASVVTGVILLVGLAALLRRRAGGRQTITVLATAAGWLFLLVAIPIGLMLRASQGATEAVTRQRIELELYGARGWDYIIPPPGTWFSSGLAGEGGIDPVRSPGGERMVFVGWLVLALFVVGVVLVTLMWRRLATRERTAFALALPVIFACAVVSLASPTRFLGFEITTPASIIFDYLPYLRAYARFGAVVLVGAVVVAALGLSLLTRGRSILWRYSWIAGAIVFSAVEMPAALPIGSGPPLLVAGQQPAAVPVWQWLRDNRVGDPVIETPAFPQESTDRIFIGGQTVHQHPLANGGMNEKNYAADFTEEYGNPFYARSASAYATAGIPLVVVQPWAWAERKLAVPDAAKPPRGMSVVKTFPDGSAVWQVTAEPRQAVAFPDRTTWDPVRTIDGQHWRYMRDAAVMRAYARSAMTARVSFTAQGYNKSLDYPLTIVGPDGRPHSFNIRGTRAIAFNTQLPRGESLFTLSVAHPANDPLGAGAMTVQTGPWTITPRS